MSRTLSAALVAALIASPALAHEQNILQPDGHAPAGVMADHMHKAGAFMVGARYMYAVSSGDMLIGDKEASDQDTANAGYTMRPDTMTMHMAMLDIMYAPTDWLNFMVMPQFVIMDMSMSMLPEATNGAGGGHGHGSHAGGHEHGVDGIGDTVLTGLVRLYNDGTHRLHAGVGVSVPTASVFERGKDGRMQHYGMQLGSGTWDLLPSLTYAGGVGDWGWGAQANLITRLEDRNKSGFRYGDQVQAMTWGSYRFLPWLSGSLRAQYTVQESIEGHYKNSHNHSSPGDLQRNYGGQFYDVGFGLNAVAQEGPLKGHRLGIEWLQPVLEAVNGVQQERTGALYVNWSVAF